MTAASAPAAPRVRPARRGDPAARSPNQAELAVIAGSVRGGRRANRRRDRCAASGGFLDVLRNVAGLTGIGLLCATGLAAIMVRGARDSAGG